MAEQFSFSLLEKIEFIQRIQALEAENAKLREELERLRLQNQVLREDLNAYFQKKAAPKIIHTDANGVVAVE